MAVKDPVKVPEKKITSVDLLGFSGGLFLGGAQNGQGNQFIYSKDVELTREGYLTDRRSLQKWLPDTDEAGYQVYPVIWEGEVLNFTVDDGRVRYCKEGDVGWTDCLGDNTFTTGPGIKPILKRVLDVVLVVNGAGGDKLAYVQLSNKTVVKYTHVADPASAPSAAATGITNSGSYKIYYGYTFSSAVGETKISPILEYTISKPRDNWAADGTEYLTVSRPPGIPAGAKFWNLYIALAANGGIIQDSDMLMVAGGLDLNQLSIVDNGTLAIDIGRGNPPIENSTDGPRCKHIIETNGRPVLFGDVDDPHNVWIGGDGEYALDFSASNGGFRSQPSKGTNFYPAVIIGFRNGQGIPALTILFSNTEGISKQATLEQQTINYGNQSFVVWGVTEQNYGAAGVAAPYSAVNYKGQLNLFSTDGMISMDTQPQLQNVIATKEIDKDIKEYARNIKTSALENIVGTGWENRLLYIVPANGFDTPNEILIRDLNNEGSFYTLKIAADWIGTVSPPDGPAFVYVRQGKKTFKLFDAFGRVDYKGGPAETFSSAARGTMIGMNEAHNGYYAVVQALFYVLGLVGDITVGVDYRDINGKIRTKKKKFSGPKYVLSSSGGWSDPQYVYNSFATPAGWSAVSEIDEAAVPIEGIDKRIPVIIGDIASEAQWWYETPNDYGKHQIRAISYEGENLGVKPDLR